MREARRIGPLRPFTVSYRVRSEIDPARYGTRSMVVYATDYEHATMAADMLPLAQVDGEIVGEAG